MATLAELVTIANHSDLNNRMNEAVKIVATEIVFESDQTANHLNRLKWAVGVIGNPDHWGTLMRRVLLGKFGTPELAPTPMTPSQLTGVSDVALLAAIRDSVNAFADNI
jgi:hypothetical protein